MSTCLTRGVKSGIGTNQTVTSFQSETSRIVHPGLDSGIMSSFIALMAKSSNFRKIETNVRQTFIYPDVSYVTYKENDRLTSRNQVLGMSIALHGRIP